MFAAFRYPSDREIITLIALIAAVLLVPPLIGAALGARGAGSKTRYFGATTWGTGAGVAVILTIVGKMYGWGPWGEPRWGLPCALAAGTLASYGLARLAASPPGCAKGPCHPLD